MSQKEQNQDNVSEMNIYELGYLLVPTIPEEQTGECVVKIRDVIEQSGFIVSENNPEELVLSYEMSKSIKGKKQRFSKAYFGALIFRIPAEKVAGTKQGLEKNDEILRFIIIRRTEDNVMPAQNMLRQPYANKKDKKNDDVEYAEKRNIDKEGIDSAIEELVVE